VHERTIQPVNRIAVLGREFREELAAGNLFLVLVDILRAVRQDHVIQALVSRAADFRMFRDRVEIFVKAALPVLLAIVAEVLLLANRVEDSFSLGHYGSPPNKRRATGRRGMIKTAVGRGRRKLAGSWFQAARRTISTLSGLDRRESPGSAV